MKYPRPESLTVSTEGTLTLLSVAELQQVNHALSELSYRGRHLSIDFSQAIYSWSRFVEQVETGYPHSKYEYVNSLGSRDIIDDMCRVVSFDLGRKITDEVWKWDRRFRAATVQTSRPLRRYREGVWWRWRVPRQPGEDLARWMREEGPTHAPSGEGRHTAR